jgi:two-component system, NtrC family, sensor histidine kinase HydH
MTGPAQRTHAGASLRNYPGRFLVVSAGGSALVLLVCGSLAFYLEREQSRTAGVLSENIGSRRAAADLEEALLDLIALEQNEAKNVEPLHERIAGHLAVIEDLADKDRERVLAAQAVNGFAAYLSAWRAGRPPDERVRLLRGDPLAACQELRNFNAGQIEESNQDHIRALRRMTWGLAVVGGLGSVAGLVLGYGLARGLQRTIHRFLVRVEGASELLGQELPSVEWEPKDAPPDEAADALAGRVEQVVRRLQQREREVRRAERLAALGQLAAGVAHEIRNPLTSVILLLETCRKDPDAGGLTEEDLDLIEQELHRIERSLQTFLDYSRPPEPQRAPTELGSVVRDALPLVRSRADQQRVKIEVDLSSGPVPLHADAAQLRQVVLNLLLNALDALPGGGRVNVTVGRSVGDMAEIIVADSGLGISAEQLSRLFEPFASTKDTGLGLGLVVSKRIVEDHSGTIHGSNRPAGGACFTVRLPVAERGS